ncbi:hypothetical protein [Rhodopseudomonas sp. WA056]|uniref:hypothetical protein n=1 Tax=Rhodopseudomonas sp. WA056 TaxID=2269367 RepID=UPI00031AC281|nr:hypothetical protein [Rhodopseudomonas sp. WA056]
MRHQAHLHSATTPQRLRSWSSFAIDIHVLMLGAALGLIGAIVIAAPHLRLS